MRLDEIVMKLAGPIQPVGECSEDARRKKNLDVLTDVVDRLLCEIERAAESADRPETSMSAIGKRASEFLQEVRHGD